MLSATTPTRTRVRLAGQSAAASAQPSCWLVGSCTGLRSMNPPAHGESGGVQPGSVAAGVPSTHPPSVRNSGWPGEPARRIRFILITDLYIKTCGGNRHTSFVRSATTLWLQVPGLPGPGVFETRRGWRARLHVDLPGVAVLHFCRPDPLPPWPRAFMRLTRSKVKMSL